MRQKAGEEVKRLGGEEKNKNSPIHPFTNSPINLTELRSGGEITASSSAALSLSIHILIVTLLLFFETPHKKTFEKYMTVRIVSTVSTQPNISSQAESPSDNGIKELPSPRVVPKELSRKEQIIEEALHAIKAKKRIEKIARLRAEIRKQKSEVGEDAKRFTGKEENTTLPLHQFTNSPKDFSGSDSRYSNNETYVKIVTGIIHSNWTYPEVAGRGLKGSVVILIERNGSVKIQEFNSSGDRLFDYSIRNAILKSTLPPPPEELEIEVRFTQ